MQGVKMTMKTNGLPAAFKEFKYVREHSAVFAFADGGCHRRAHELGDALYYEYYAQEQGLDQVDLSADVQICNYGLVHGFIEHFVENDPTPSAAAAMCDYFKRRLQQYSLDADTIAGNCYSGSGHGFMLAQMQNVGKENYGNANAFIEKPMKNCDALPVSNKEKVECRRSAFDTFFQAFFEGQYGFIAGDARAFALCKALPLGWQADCYYGAAEKVGKSVQRDPHNLASLVDSTISDPRMRRIAFMSHITSIVQQTGSDAGVRLLLSQCADVPTYFQECVEGAILGLSINEDPATGYSREKALCETSIIAEHGAHAACLSALTRYTSSPHVQ